MFLSVFLSLWTRLKLTWDPRITLTMSILHKHMFNGMWQMNWIEPYANHTQYLITVDYWPPGMTRTVVVGAMCLLWPPLTLRPIPAHSGPPRTTAQRSGFRCRSTRSLNGSTVISKAQADKWGPLHCVLTDEIDLPSLFSLSTLPTYPPLSHPPLPHPLHPPLLTLSFSALPYSPSPSPPSPTHPLPPHPSPT